jgi:hypothetical protein
LEERFEKKKFLKGFIEERLAQTDYHHRSGYFGAYTEKEPQG